jgi:hypothetical protein
MRQRNSLEHWMAMFEKDKISNSSVPSDAKTSVSDKGQSSRKKSLMDWVPWIKATVKKVDSEWSNWSDHDGSKRSSSAKKGSTTGTTKTDFVNSDASPTEMGTKVDNQSTNVPSTPEQMSPIKSKLPTGSLVDIDPPKSPGFMASLEDKQKSVLNRVQKFQKKNKFSTKPLLRIVSPRFLKPKHPMGAGKVQHRGMRVCQWVAASSVYWLICLLLKIPTTQWTKTRYQHQTLCLHRRHQNWIRKARVRWVLLIGSKLLIARPCLQFLQAGLESSPLT